MDLARMIAERRGVSVGAVLFGKCEEEVRRFLKSGGSCGAPAGAMECLSLAATPRLFLRSLEFV
jgi:hypothetical protein